MQSCAAIFSLMLKDRQMELAHHLVTVFCSVFYFFILHFLGLILHSSSNVHHLLVYVPLHQSAMLGHSSHSLWPHLFWRWQSHLIYCECVTLTLLGYRCLFKGALAILEVCSGMFVVVFFRFSVWYVLFFFIAELLVMDQIEKILPFIQKLPSRL